MLLSPEITPLPLRTIWTEKRGEPSSVTMSRRRASMEGGMAGRGMSASPQPAEIIKLIKQNFLKSWKRGVLARSLKVRGFQEVFVLSWPFAVYAAAFL